MIKKVTLKNKKLIDRIFGKNNLKKYVFEFPQDEDIILIGGVNGSGKSTLLNSLNSKPIEKFTLKSEKEERLKEFKETVELTNNTTKVIFWSNTKNNLKNIKHTDELFGNEIIGTGNSFNLFLESKRISEGENILTHMKSFVSGLIKMLIENKNKDEEIVLVIDELDSGLSDNIIYLIMKMFKNISKKYNIKFIISCNTYIMVKMIGKIYPVDLGGRYIELKTYEDWFDNFIIPYHESKLEKEEYLSENK